MLRVDDMKILKAFVFHESSRTTYLRTFQRKRSLHVILKVVFVTGLTSQSMMLLTGPLVLPEGGHLLVQKVQVTASLNIFLIHLYSVLHLIPNAWLKSAKA